MAKGLACAFILFLLVACTSTTSRGREQLSPGLTTAQVKKLMGKPDGRSFNESNEAWQYQDVVGFGQCEYLTAWFTDGVLRSVTTRRGGSVAGCGLGSSPVDWNQMPR